MVLTHNGIRWCFQGYVLVNTVVSKSNSWVIASARDHCAILYITQEGWGGGGCDKKHFLHSSNHGIFMLDCWCRNDIFHNFTRRLRITIDDKCHVYTILRTRNTRASTLECFIVHAVQHGSRDLNPLKQWLQLDVLTIEPHIPHPQKISRRKEERM